MYPYVAYSVVRSTDNFKRWNNADGETRATHILVGLPRDIRANRELNSIRTALSVGQPAGVTCSTYADKVCGVSTGFVD